ncbi:MULTISPECIES: sugar phosphate isomerase/epimerase family protein [Streptomyces]|uniref:Sugar phosphate isomerase/epimerase n=1 Tax=Streptomyces dengpaensis TaxID=2049881 RepID=A0ABN5HWM5_9ACTN|nr:MULTISPECIES: sugar phosphate isomerase/epimerase family protein [Streptomyces]AVH55549.1 sugar phosphate isomerase/epimerase [Streptomyces dengpaensis]PIB11810.1 xylose isomerase [Streptomyces sp. HG99]
MQEFIVLNPDELGQDPAVGMDLAVALGVRYLEIRTAYGANALMLDDGQLREVRRLADERGLQVTALASPLWKWCRPEAVPGKVDSFGFPTQVPAEDRERWVDRALAVADILGTGLVRVFSHLSVGNNLTESFVDDPLLTYALKHAERAGVRLLLENEPVCTVAEPTPLLDVLRPHTGLGLWLDLGNLYEVGYGTAEAVEALAPYAEYVHIKDFVPRDDGMKQFVAAGDGDVPYAELLPALHRVRPALPYALETHVHESPGGALTRGAAFLRASLPGGLA